MRYDVWEFSNAPEFTPRGGVVAIHANLSEATADAKVTAIRNAYQPVHSHWADKRRVTVVEHCEGCPMTPEQEADWQAGEITIKWRLCYSHNAEMANPYAADY